MDTLTVLHNCYSALSAIRCLSHTYMSSQVYLYIVASIFGNHYWFMSCESKYQIISNTCQKKCQSNIRPGLSRQYQVWWDNNPHEATTEDDKGTLPSRHTCWHQRGMEERHGRLEEKVGVELAWQTRWLTTWLLGRYRAGGLSNRRGICAHRRQQRICCNVVIGLNTCDIFFSRYNALYVY